MPIDSKFNLDDYSLSNLFCVASVQLNSLSQGRTLNYTNCLEIEKVSSILKEASRSFRTRKECNTDSYFFWDFYGKKKEESNRYETRELYADRLIILSEKLAVVKELPKEEVEELGAVCAKLSKNAMGWWNSQHPNGFKKE